MNNRMKERLCRLPMDDGAEIYCKISGCGTPLLMIHGMVVDADFFDMCRDFLAERHTVITYDRRGCSRSGGAQGALEREALDAANILQYFGNEMADVVGCNAGGIVACALAQRYPRLVRKVVLHELPLFDVADLTVAEIAWVDKAHDLVRNRKTAVAAVGANSMESLCGRATRALADSVGISCVVFPGGHNAAKEVPNQFATQIEGILA